LELFGSDFFAEGLSFAEERVVDATFLQMDARHIPFWEEFDVIGAFDVLEHIVEDEEVLSQMFRAVKPGGGILLTAPQHRFLWSASDDYAHHQRRYTRKELARKVTRAGFEIERMTSFVSLLLPLMLLARIRPQESPGDCSIWAELRVPRSLNTVFGKILDFERGIIQKGFALPAGGSLLLIARRR
jgi:SAM-dependent methyltransferase